LNYIDYIILGILFVGFILGYKDGLVRKIIGVLGLVIGLFLGIKFSKEAGILLAPAFNDELYLSEIIGGVLIFLITIFLASVIKRLIHPADKVNKFLNQLLGGIAGVLQLMFFVSALLLFLNIFQFPNQNLKESSLLYSSVYSIIPKTIELVSGSSIDAKGFIKDYIESQDSINTVNEDTTIINN